MILPGQHNFSATRTNEEWLDAAQAICRANDLSGVKPYRFESSDHAVFLIDGRRVLKIYNGQRECFEREKWALGLVQGRLRVATPEVVAVGCYDGLDYLIISRLPGRGSTRSSFLYLTVEEQIKIVNELAGVFRDLHSMDPEGTHDDWPAFVASQAASFLEQQIAHGVNRIVLEALPGFMERNLGSVPLAPTVFLHGDVHFGNLQISNAGVGPWLCGLFDFADSRRGFHEYDFVAVGVLMLQGQRDLQRRFFMEYGYAESGLDEEMRERLMMLTMLYETADLRRYAIRLSPEAVDYPLDRLTREIWNFV
jgi:hygromycin-B 7''-O-kinase